MIQRQPQVGETIEDIVTNQFIDTKETKNENMYRFFCYTANDKLYWNLIIWCIYDDRDRGDESGAART
ncbi:hypothetical protein GCM10020331_032040 [Ectobacillus funiculus]